jgi:hypothetical protein
MYSRHIHAKIIKVKVTARETKEAIYMARGRWIGGSADRRIGGRVGEEERRI